MAEQTTTPHDPLWISSEDCRHYSNALADVLCWFAGFAAARPKAILPPGIDTMRHLNIELKDHY